ncbi:hypothetical protein N865_19075 [Intrasporangium oryzae NRRL B-24470]|uniref:Antitoxin n=1 Tax=Intrasporangium oryzae NRRL B-24470 TaxID=1386089 RepID=W9GAU6_9MICO|nr:antitoxin [Intrasporangium oryzae]EWT03321.1 hypothetical protein N865_19075 [Intrasporangium oryzae NRRL B-24470]
MSFSEQMRQKAEEVRLQAKAKDFGDAVAQMVKATVEIAAGYASQNRAKVDGMLDKAEVTIVDRTGSKHADTVAKVRGKVDQGFDKLVEHGGAKPGVPDDTTSAFTDDDEPSAGSPS